MSKPKTKPGGIADENRALAAPEPAVEVEPERDGTERDRLTAGKSIMQGWLRTHQPAPVAGVTESLSNTPSPRMPGQLASGHAVTDSPPGGDPHDPGRVDRHDWNQVTRPSPLASLATVEGSGPLASSIACHQGRAQVQVLDQRSAANPSLAGQLGPRDPSGSPVSPGDHQAPSGHGESFGTTPQRAPGMAWLTSAIGGQRSAGYTMTPSRSAPGE